MEFTRSQVEKAVKSKGYKWFENGDYNLNIVGIRNSSTNEAITNKFDDLITVSYKIDEIWYFHQWEATTDPGLHWAENLLNKDGVAILVPGQYRGSHAIGRHRNYTALRQQKPLKVYRDNDKDKEYDLIEENIQEGIYYINIHRANAWGTSTQIDKWSAGCQVIANNNNFDKLMELANKSKDKWGNSFTYTLIESKDIV
jgi:hypothetical protein